MERVLSKMRRALANDDIAGSARYGVAMAKPITTRVTTTTTRTSSGRGLAL